MVRGLISCRVQASSHALSVALEWAATASSAKAVSTVCIRSAVSSDPDYRCTRCQGTACPLDGRPQREVQVGPDKPRLLSFKTHGRVYSSCVQSAMLHASDTWLLTKPILQSLLPNDRTMIRQICNVKPQDTATIRSTELLARLGIEDLDLILKERRLCWYGHVEFSNSAVKTAFDIQVDGKRGPGRPKMTWRQLTERDRREWKLSAIDPHARDTWRSGVRSAMRAASQLPVVDMAPVPARSSKIR